MSNADIKKEKEFFKKLDKLLLNKKETIINWLETAQVHGNYISGHLLNDNKLQIITTSEYGIYNIILKWFIINKEKFEGYYYLFKNIPSTNFIDISNINLKLSSSNGLELNIEDALKKWKENPQKNPYDNSDLKISIVPTSQYGLLYQKFCNHLTSKLESPILPIIFEKEIRNKLPDNHIYAFKDIDYIEKLKSHYQDEEWIKFLDAKKDVFYKNENVNNVTGSTVYDFLFMHYFLIKNIKKIDENSVINYIDNQLFLYETILAQIKHIKADHLNCYEIFESMVNLGTDRTGYNEGDNFKLIKKKKDKTWPYEIPPLLNLFVEYINEINYYILSISKLHKIIYDEFFLYGKKISAAPSTVIYNVMVESINYNIYRLKTIINIIFSSLYTNNGNSISERINIKQFFNLLFYSISNCIGEKNIWNRRNFRYEPAYSKFISINNILAYTMDRALAEGGEVVDEYKFKMFLVSAIFDIEILHNESLEYNSAKYEPVIDPYDNLPAPPEVPKPVIISQALQRYKMTSHIVGKKSQKEKELKEFEKKQSNYKKELKKYDKILKEYNDKHLDKKLSPYFSVKLSRAKSVINDKSSLRLSYSPLKVSAKSLTKFKSSKNKALLSKFEKEPYSRTYKKKKDDEKREEIGIEKFREREREAEDRRNAYLRETERRERARRDPARIREAQEYAMQQLATTMDRERAERERAVRRFGYGGSKKKLSKSDLKLKLALEADNPKFKKYAKSLSPSGKSPRQKYVECDLNDNDPLTQQAFSDMHFKKIKYLSKIKTTLENGKIITNCYDTIPLYNYILDCNNKGIIPVNYAQGRTPFDILQLDEVYKKIKNFTKKPTLERNINTTHKIFLNTYYEVAGGLMHGLPYYKLYANISIGSISFPVSRDSFDYWGDSRLKIMIAPIISRDDILFEDTSDNTVLLIEKGIKNGSLLKFNKYPYWHKEGIVHMPTFYDFLILPPFSWSYNDNFDRMKERTHVLNNRIERII